jgi:flagellar basal-body rod protein FlgC
VSLFNIFAISGSALSAQSVRLNTISSNLANADVVSGNAEDVYKARYPIFSAALDSAWGQQSTGVRVEGITESEIPPRMEYDPAHPLANEDGNVFLPNVNSVDETANMISAARTYQSNVEAMNTTKQLIIRTLSLGS